MNLSKYFQGKGADVSRNSNVNLGDKSVKKFIEPNNFYSLKSISDHEKLDFIYSNNLINESKFYRILIKEWFYFCKVKGYIIIKMKSNKLLNFNELLKECNLLLKDKIEVVEKKYDENSKIGIIVLKKILPSLKKEDSMDKWSFGIITDGKNSKRLDKELDSIIALKIPHFEIIICGEHDIKSRKNVKIIPFDVDSPAVSLDRSKKNIKCVKKNIICKNAKYENLVITHDKFLFDKNWYEGMEKYGNYFEILSCALHNESEQRVGDWLVYGSRLKRTRIIGMMNYKDWNKEGYIDGGFYILKKSVWEKVPWDESRGNISEDIKLSKDFYDLGILSRFNPYSKCINLEWKHGKTIVYGFNNKTLGNFKIIPVEKYYWLIRQFVKEEILGRKTWQKW